LDEHGTDGGGNWKVRTIFVTAVSIVILANPMVARLGAGMAFTPQQCPLSPVEERAMLDATYRDFDQGMGARSWRSLLNRGCAGDAAFIIGRYIAAHSASLAEEELRLLSFHHGQTRALDGQKKEAIPPLLAALVGKPSPEWRAYVDATVAFLESDKSALRAARERYAVVSRPGAMRLAVIDGLLACFEKPYSVAWMCRVSK
jgi:hypothetical protein